MPDARVAIEPSMAHKFQLEMWDALDDRGRRALGEYLSERLQANGWSIREPMALRPCGPRHRAPLGASWREPSSGMTFALIPRGKFRPGFDKAQMDRVAELISLDAGNKSGVAASLLAKVEPVLRLKPTVEISPFFLAAELVRPSLPGLRTVVQLKDDVIEGRNVGNFDFMGDGVEFRGGQVEPVLSHFGWSLATSVEFEWALRGCFVVVLLGRRISRVHAGSGRRMAKADPARAREGQGLVRCDHVGRVQPRPAPGLAVVQPIRPGCDASAQDLVRSLDGRRRLDTGDRPRRSCRVIPVARRLLRVVESLERF